MAEDEKKKPTMAPPSESDIDENIDEIVEDETGVEIDLNDANVDDIDQLIEEDDLVTPEPKVIETKADSTKSESCYPTAQSINPYKTEIFTELEDITDYDWQVIAKELGMKDQAVITSAEGLKKKALRLKRYEEYSASKEMCLLMICKGSIKVLQKENGEKKLEIYKLNFLLVSENMPFSLTAGEKGVVLVPCTIEFLISILKIDVPNFICLSVNEKNIFEKVFNIASLKKELTDAKNQLGELQTKMQQLSQLQMKTLEEKNNLGSQYREQISNLESTIEKLRLAKQQLLTEKSQLESQIDQEKNDVKNVLANFCEEKDQLLAQKTDLEQQLIILKAECLKLGLDNTRLINLISLCIGKNFSDK